MSRTVTRRSVERTGVSASVRRIFHLLPAYVLVGVEWHSQEAFDAYAEDVEETIQRFGGRYIVGARDYELREGGWRPPIVVVLEFPTLDAARRWYDSNEYAPLLEIRKQGATSDLILVDGLDE